MGIQGTIESLLFVAGDNGLALSDFVALTHHTVTDIEESLVALQEKYTQDNECGLAIVSFAGKYQMVTKGKYANVIKQYAISPYASRLSQAALETLAIIAYKQPLTRAMIDNIRGVQSTGSIQKLLLRDLVEVKGRENSPGKPILYGTTDFFMNYFGLNSLDELPNIADLEVVDDSELQDLFTQRYDQLEQNDIEKTETD